MSHNKDQETVRYSSQLVKFEYDKTNIITIFETKMVNNKEIYDSIKQEKKKKKKKKKKKEHTHKEASFLSLETWN